MNWTLEKKKKITEVINNESKKANIVHKILSWGEPVKSLNYTSFKEKSTSFYFSNNFVIVLIKYKGQSRHEVLYISDEVDEEELLRIKQNYKILIGQLIDYCENNRNGFAPLQPLEGDLDIIKYICEYITGDNFYKSIKWEKSLYSSSTYDNIIFLFEMNNPQSKFSIHWYELLFYHLPYWENKMPDDIFKEYRKLQVKYTKAVPRNRFDLKNHYTIKQ